MLKLSDLDLKEFFPYKSASESDCYEELAACFSYFKQQLLLPGGTREVLWKEYMQTHPDGYVYIQFNEHYNNWLNQTRASSKLTHKAGLRVDYCGKKLQMVKKETGEVQGCGSVRWDPAMQQLYLNRSQPQPST